MRNYDLCIITAANDRQAEGYRKQLEWRKSRGMLPDGTEFLVYADPHGRRIGSGGSTIYVLHRLLERSGRDFEGAFRNKRILILHSGGDSRRLPAYSAMGKIFVPLPTERYFALFDILLDNFMQLPCLDEGQVIAASGDVILSFEPSYVAFSDTGVTGVAYPDSPDVASGHGVYVTLADSSERNPRKVVDFLQKPNLDELRGANALDLANRAFVDTGIMNFAIDAVERLVQVSELREKIASGDISLDLYKEIAFAMLNKEEIPYVHQLAEIPFFVNLLPYCDFFHIGRSRQFLRNFYSFTHASALYDFHSFTRSNAKDYPRLRNGFIYNTFISTNYVEIEEPVFVEGCHLNGKLKLEGENILTGVPENAGDISLERGICLTVVPVEGDNWASIVYGINDDFKHLLEDNECTFLNISFSEWIEKSGVSLTDLWKEDEIHELWNTRLFPVSDDPAKSIQISLSLQEKGRFSVDSWKTSRRMSLKEILRSTENERVLVGYSHLDRRAKLVNIESAITRDDDLPSEDIISLCQERKDYVDLAKKAISMIDRSEDLLFQSRLYKLLSNTMREAYNKGIDLSNSISTDLDSETSEDKAFELICEAIGRGIPYNELSAQKIQIRSDEVVWVCAPVRLDFAGGWSDTPPYCLERGGSVLNAAVTLNGQYPVQVVGKIHPEPIITVNSIDLREHIVVSEISDMLSYQDPSDWSSLPKAAFVATGIISEDTDLSLQDILKGIGGGIDLTLFSAVPSGSGLGTSSILGSAIIACLSRILGIELPKEDLFSRTLYMEQLMTTGGGWQDQIGGVVGGVKHIKTESDLFQIPRISWTDLRVTPDMDLSERFLLYYTGYRRMAKNILRNIVGKYLDRDVVTLQTIDRLQAKSFEMKEDLDHRNIDAFGGKIADAWELNKTLDPGTSNEEIEAILGRISHLIHGAKLLGAGGGGFFFIVTRGIEESQKVRQILKDEPPNERARFFDFEVDPEGLKISVL